METLVVVDYHRSRYYGKNKGYDSRRRAFGDINGRTFQSGAGILPTPVKVWKPVAESGFGVSTNSPFPKTPSPDSEEKTNTRKYKRSTLKKSSSVPIPFNLELNSDKEKSLYSKELSYSELWAGPAYSNSPPPSSLPIPKFTVPPRRAMSLDLPSSAAEMDFYPVSRSAPPSPKRDDGDSARKGFNSADCASATKDLRRILNLDLTDE